MGLLLGPALAPTVCMQHATYPNPKPRVTLSLGARLALYPAMRRRARRVSIVDGVAGTHTGHRARARAGLPYSALYKRTRRNGTPATEPLDAPLHRRQRRNTALRALDGTSSAGLYVTVRRA